MNSDQTKKALIAMSGGVDSSVAAYLMQQQGYTCTSVTMKLFSGSDERVDNTKDARSVSQALGIPFCVLDFSEDFHAQVIRRFTEVYKRGATPNPCIDCNRYMKFGKLHTYARQAGMDVLATGHYARIDQDPVSGRYILKKALDESKDQSYVLYALTQEQLAHTAFPLGSLRKQEVRQIAQQQGFVNAEKSESQDICFVQDGDYAGFIERYTGEAYDSGDFIDTEGNVLGRHKGLIHYTIGQRKGLGLSAANRMYVCEKNPEDNTVTLGESGDLFSGSLDAVDFHWIAYENIRNPIRAKASIRYRQTPQWATVTKTSPDSVHIVFDKPQRAIAKGQAVVVYDGDMVVGGGTIV